MAAFVPGGAFSHEALYELQPRVGRPFTWTALLTTPDGNHRRLMEIHRAGRARGAQVHPQVSCRPLVAQTTLAQPFTLRCDAVRELDRATFDGRVAAYRDPAWRARARAGLAQALLPPRWTHWTVAESEGHPHLIGRTVAEIAGVHGADPLDTALDVSLDDGLRTRFTVVLANDEDDEVRQLLRLDGAVLGLSDAGAHPDQLCDAVQPTDLLGGWVRDRGALALEEAVRKLTWEPASLYGFRDRGVVRPGAVADLVVFDPAVVGPGSFRRVRDQPGGGERLVADQPTGVVHVMVGGVPIRRDSRSEIDELAHGPGQVLRGGSSNRKETASAAGG